MRVCRKFIDEMWGIVANYMDVCALSLIYEDSGSEVPSWVQASWYETIN